MEKQKLLFIERLPAEQLKDLQDKIPGCDIRHYVRVDNAVTVMRATRDFTTTVLVTQPGDDPEIIAGHLSELRRALPLPWHIILYGTVVPGKWSELGAHACIISPAIADLAAAVTGR